MKFTPQMIELAIRFKAGGVPWQPAPGDYVLDRQAIVQRESPFQPGVYFILNLPHFAKLAGGPEDLQEKLVWLPTWDQARAVLRDAGLSDAAQQVTLVQREAIATNRELITLYELICERFPPRAAAGHAPE
jgi:hypothetical protein